MHRENPISSTHEMYLKVLHEARGEHGVSRVGDLAKRLDVSPGTVSTVLKKLERMHFVKHERSGSMRVCREAGVGEISARDVLVWACAGLRGRGIVGKFLVAIGSSILLASSAAHAQESPYFVNYDHYLEEPGALEIAFNPVFGTQ